MRQGERGENGDRPKSHKQYLEKSHFALAYFLLHVTKYKNDAAVSVSWYRETLQ